MNNQSESVRTSAGQLKWAGSVICSIFCGLARHVKNFGLFYGFVSGSFVTLCVLAALIWYVVLDFPLPWKITNPSDPRFDPMKFEFTDYGPNEIRNILPVMFPVGTNKSEVDKVFKEIKFIRAGKVAPYKHNEEKRNNEEYYYEYRPLRSFVLERFAFVPEGEFTYKVYFSYDFEGNLLRIHVI